MDHDLLQKILGAAVAFLYAIGWWAWNRSVKRRDDMETRLMVLEKHSITREELQKTIRDASEDRRSMHAENQECLKELRNLIQQNEARRSKTEHDIRDSVYTLVARIASHEAYDKGRQAKPPRRE